MLECSYRCRAIAVLVVSDVMAMAWGVIVTLLIGLVLSFADKALAYDVVEVPDGGSIVGRVSFIGPIPRLPALVVLKDREACAVAAAPQMLLVSADSGGVKNTVIALENITRGKAPLASQPSLENRDCMLIPRVQAVMAGTEIVVRNADPFLHTTRGRLPDSKQAFNLVFPRGTPEKEQKIRFPGVIAVTCDTHTHMKAYILAFEHPYFTVTDAHGQFEIAQVPPGVYRVQAWHEGWNIVEYDKESHPKFEEPYTMSAEVTVPPGQITYVEFRLSARE